MCEFILEKNIITILEILQQIVTSRIKCLGLMYSYHHQPVINVSISTFATACHVIMSRVTTSHVITFLTVCHVIAILSRYSDFSFVCSQNQFASDWCVMNTFNSCSCFYKRHHYSPLNNLNCSNSFCFGFIVYIL